MIKAKRFIGIIMVFALVVCAVPFLFGCQKSEEKKENTLLIYYSNKDAELKAIELMNRRHK